MVSALDVVAPRMLALQQLGDSLKRLDMMWKVIETTAKVVSPTDSLGFIATLATTRTAFGSLAKEMAEQIAATHLANRQRDLASKAQVAIDILVRNLFERTADVGFIATDGPITAFVQASDESDVPVMEARLKEYRSKYTVYEDILVLDAQAHILLSLDGNHDAVASIPPWWQDMLQKGQYVEIYGTSSLYPADQEVLLYAHRIASAQDAACGAIVLRFDLVSELASIFAALIGPSEHTAIVFIDDNNCIQASSAPTDFKPHNPLHFVAKTANAPLLVSSQGRTYLAEVRKTRGYQGYTGLPWTAVALIRLEHAFGRGGHSSATGPQATDSTDAEIDANSVALQLIISQSQAIEQDLNRVIWNGKLTDASSQQGASMHPVFEEIGRTGQQTIKVFNDSISELRELSMAGLRAEIRAHAALAVNIMDRNLYERANDCRWWALSEDLAGILGELAVSDDNSARYKAGQILDHLNDLYTVYSRIALFDAHGNVVASSKNAEGRQGAMTLDAALISQTLSLKGTQAYTVSPLEASSLANGAPTYVYCAAIRMPGQTKVVGGIALAFNCETEFHAMLRDAAPGGEPTTGLFVDAQGTVLSSTSDDIRFGDRFPALCDLIARSKAGPCEDLVDWSGTECIAGVAPGTGYREFKRTDGYEEAVFSVLLKPIKRNPIWQSSRQLPVYKSTRSPRTRRFGVVVCGSFLYGFSSDQVIEARAVGTIVRVLSGDSSIGVMEHLEAGNITMIKVFNLRLISGQQAMEGTQQAVAVIVRMGGTAVALLVDRLLDVLACDTIDAAPAATVLSSPWVSGTISGQTPGTEIVFTVDTHRFDFAHP